MEQRAARAVSTPSTITIAQRIRNRRLELRWSTRQLGRRAGVSKSTIGRIEYGDVKPSAATLKRIALALGTTYSDLTRPAGPRLRTKKVPPTEDVPFAVGKLLIRVGNVTRDELNMLCRNYADPDFAEDSTLLELNLLFRRACASMHDRAKKKAFDAAFERLRADMERSR